MTLQQLLVFTLALVLWVVVIGAWGLLSEWLDERDDGGPRC